MDDQKRGRLRKEGGFDPFLAGNETGHRMGKGECVKRTSGGDAMVTSDEGVHLS